MSDKPEVTVKCDRPGCDHEHFPQTDEEVLDFIANTLEKFNAQIGSIISYISQQNENKVLISEATVLTLGVLTTIMDSYNVPEEDVVRIIRMIMSARRVHKLQHTDVIPISPLHVTKKGSA